MRKDRIGKNIRAVLFDLDGTLLPMELGTFMRGYFGLLAGRLSRFGYTQKQIVDATLSGLSAMLANDGKKTNEDVFWQTFALFCGARSLADKPQFLEFYKTDFQAVKNFCGYHPAAAETVRRIRAAGYRTVLATNPTFPAAATESRMRWAGLAPSDFELYTTYEDFSHCKPNPAYYMDVCERIGLAPEACLMVGNDATEDMVAETLGMEVFLLTDCLLNQENKDLTAYPQGSFGALAAYIGLGGAGK